MADSDTDVPDAGKSLPEDDSPRVRDVALPPDVLAPLAPFAGEPPPTPPWFANAVAQAPERSFVTSLGTRIEVLTWGEVGKPGLLFVHGNSAHADWWRFIAPFFAADYRIAAMSLPGMGASDWRERYTFTDFSQDAEAVARAAGLYADGGRPIYIGHSFGGAQVFSTSVRHPERMRAAILIDVAFGRPPKAVRDRIQRLSETRNIPTADSPAKVYATLAEALGRFRLMPPQPAGNLFAADFIARHSLKRAPLERGTGEGWAWRFDPNMWIKLDITDMGLGGRRREDLEVPLVHFYGAQSRLMEHRLETARTLFPPGHLEIEIPDAGHHVMVDQPLALVAGLRTLLAAWPPAA